MSLSQTLRGGHQGLARIVCFFGGAIWGLYWIPLRELDAAGILGVWATGAFHLIPLALLIPIVLFRRQYWRNGGLPLQATGAAMGLAILLYSTAFLYTDVVRALLLFYLNPIWGALLARFWLKEEITFERMIGIAFGLVGMVILLKIDHGIPWPQGAGDWLALGSGLAWAVSATLTRRYPMLRTVDIVSGWFIWAAIFTIVAGTLFTDPVALPTLSAFGDVLIWLVPLSLLIVLPTYLGITWGLPQLNPGTSGLLFMTELSVGALSAALLTQEVFGVREGLGIILISLAGLAEILLPRIRALGRRF
ncbi:MAG: DMT family transporter [Arenicellales bacterium]|jgi:drug/metabolite transporter (DMT)-like permease